VAGVARQEIIEAAVQSVSDAPRQWLTARIMVTAIATTLDPVVMTTKQVPQGVLVHHHIAIITITTMIPATMTIVAMTVVSMTVVAIMIMTARMSMPMVLVIVPVVLACIVTVTMTTMLVVVAGISGSRPGASQRHRQHHGGGRYPGRHAPACLMRLSPVIRT